MKLKEVMELHKWEGTFNNKGEILTRYTHATDEGKAKRNMIIQLNKDLKRNVSAQFNNAMKDNVRIKDLGPIVSKANKEKHSAVGKQLLLPAHGDVGKPES